MKIVMKITNYLPYKKKNNSTIDIAEVILLCCSELRQICFIYLFILVHLVSNWVENQKKPQKTT